MRSRASLLDAQASTCAIASLAMERASLKNPPLVALRRRHYGAEAGTAALKWLPAGGLFIAGGVVTHIFEDWIAPADSPFMRGLTDKGRLSDAVRHVPVSIVLKDTIGSASASLARALPHGSAFSHPVENCDHRILNRALGLQIILIS